MRQRTSKHSRLTVILIWLSLVAVAMGCGNDDSPSPNPKADTDEELDTNDTPTQLVRLTIQGNVEPSYMGTQSGCVVEVPDEQNRQEKLVSEGSFDLLVFTYGGGGYPMHLWVEAEPLTTEASGEVMLAAVELGFTPPPDWPSSAIPGQTIELSDSIPIGSSKIVNLELFDDTVAGVLNSLFDDPNIDAGQWAGFLVELTLVGYAPSGAELRATLRYPLKLCRGCVVDKSDPQTKCCFSNVDETAYERIRKFNQLLSSLPDQDERCHLFYDRDTFIYCSWLPDCYYNELNCPSYSCQRK